MKNEQIYARITGTGHYVPEKTVTNTELFNILQKHFDVERARMTLKNADGLEAVDVFDQWVKNGTGITERRVYDRDFDDDPLFRGDTESMAFTAAARAMDSAGLTPKELDFIVFATFTETNKIPNPACTLAGMLEVNCGGIPINTACSGFVDGLNIANNFIKAGGYKNILVVGSERLSKVVNHDNVPTAILFGDGAAAAVVSRSKEPGIIATHSSTNYDDHQILLLAEYFGGKEAISMNGGPDVLRQAATAMKEVTDNLRLKARLTMDAVRYLCPHQANGRIIAKFAKMCMLDDDRVVNIIERYGNMSCASVGIALDKLIRGEVPGKKLYAGDLVAMPVVGGGYTKAGILFRHI